MKPCGTYDEFYSQDMAIVRTRFQWLMLIVSLSALFACPLFLSDYLISVINIIGITIIAALGLQILTGYCGQLSLGHVAFVAIGAYISSMLTYHLNWSWLAALPCAIIGSALFGLIFGLPALRIKGFYLALSTMAAHFIVIWLILHGGTVTGAQDGLPVPAIDFGPLSIINEQNFFYLIIGIMVITTFAAKNLVRMRLGRAFIAIRDNDIAAEFMGINVFYYKMVAFVIASAYAGLAGALYAPYFGIISTGHFAFIESLWYLGFLIVGGLGSITGVYFGVIFLFLLRQLVMIAGPEIPNIIPGLSESVMPAMMQIFFGTVIALFLIFEPRGIYHRWEMVKSSIRIWPFPY